MPSDAVQCKPLEVVVSDRGIERAIKMLKRKLASEGVLRELKMRRHYMKPSVKRRKKQAEANHAPSQAREARRGAAEALGIPARAVEHLRRQSGESAHAACSPFVVCLGPARGRG